MSQSNDWLEIPISEDLESDLHSLFWHSNDEEEAFTSWGRKKNLLLCGPNFVDKDFWIEEIASRVNEADASWPSHLIGMNPPPTPDEIFLCGTKSRSCPYPTENDVLSDVVARSLSRQTFLEAVSHAISTSETTVLILKDLTLRSIDDLFGEAFQLLSAQRRGSNHDIKSSADGSELWLPENFYVVASASSYDESNSELLKKVAGVFSVIDVKPKYNSAVFEYLLRRGGISPQIVKLIQSLMAEINRTLSDQSDNLHTDTIGHGYFIPTDRIQDESLWLRSIVMTEILPLLTRLLGGNSRLSEHLISEFRKSFD